ncbi:hypothetical protein [Amycolatopsis sp. WGS_07]|uniref:hypothetical protein n=1 Tax=Amycolatopsis sp. WGS_07 TaxID=3076764 RepID=UPI003873B986
MTVSRGKHRMDAPEQDAGDVLREELDLLHLKLTKLFSTPLPVPGEEPEGQGKESGDTDFSHGYRPLTDSEIGSAIGRGAVYVKQLRAGLSRKPAGMVLRGIAHLYRIPASCLTDPNVRLDEIAVPSRAADSPHSRVHPMTRRLRELFNTKLPVSEEEQQTLRRKSGNPDLPHVYRALTDKEIAAATPHTPQYIQQLRTGERTNPSYDFLEAVAARYRIPVGLLVTPLADLDPTATFSDRVASLFYGVEKNGKLTVRFTPEDVAAKTGADPKLLRAICDGEYSADEVPITLPHKLAHFFGIDVTYFLHEVEDPDKTTAVADTVQWLQGLKSRGTLAAAFRRVGEIKDDTSRQRLEAAVETVIDAFMTMEQQTARQTKPPSESPDS